MKFLEFLVRNGLIRENVFTIIAHVVQYPEQWVFEDFYYLTNLSKEIMIKASLKSGRIINQDYKNNSELPDVPLNLTEKICFTFIRIQKQHDNLKIDKVLLKYPKLSDIEKDLKDKKFAKRTEYLLK